MLGLDRGAARATWTVLVIALVAALVYSIRGPLLIFSAALLLAYLLSPLVDLVDRLAPRRFPRSLSLAVVYLLLLALGVGAGVLVVTRIATDAGTLAGRLPEYLKSSGLPAELPLPEFLRPHRAEILAGVRSQIESGASELLPAMQKLGLQVLAALSNVVLVVIVPILSFFFLKDGRQFHRWLLEQVGEGPVRLLVSDILADISLVLAQFMRAIVLLSLATFTIYSLCFGIAGMPYAILLAGAAGVLEIIPVLGPLSAAAAILVVAAFSGFGHLLWIVLFLAAYRLFLDYVVQPYLMSSGVELHPLLVIFGVLAGEAVAGVAGMFLSIPVLAVVRVVYLRLRRYQATAS
jgi:predicted PurR-regulated permease PerM